MTSTVFLPIITKARELDSRLLLAASLAERGATAVVGETSRITRLALRARDGVYVTPILVPASAERLARMRSRGHVVVGWDEEGLVYPDPAWYFGIRTGAASLAQLDAYVAWGPQPAKDLREALPATTTPMVDLGNPRIDLLRPPFREVFRSRADELRAEHGPYLLVNTNFDLVNNADSGRDLLARMRATGRIRNAADEARYVAWGEFRAHLWREFLIGIPRLRSAFPDLAIVIRPHPSEDLTCWHALADRLDRVVVTPAVDSVPPWIMGSVAVLHNSCTTAVEAYLTGTPVIAFRPPGSAVAAMESPLPNELSACAETWDEVVTMLAAVKAGRPPVIAADADALLDRFVTGRSGSPATERIADLVLGLRDGSLPRPAVAPFDLPSTRHHLVRRARNWWHDRSSRDARQRFPGFTLEEVAGRFGDIASLFDSPMRCTEVEDNVVSIEPAAPVVRSALAHDPRSALTEPAAE